MIALWGSYIVSTQCFVQLPFLEDICLPTWRLSSELKLSFPQKSERKRNTANRTLWDQSRHTDRFWMCCWLLLPTCKYFLHGNEKNDLNEQSRSYESVFLFQCSRFSETSHYVLSSQALIWSLVKGTRVPGRTVVSLTRKNVFVVLKKEVLTNIQNL